MCKICLRYYTHFPVWIYIGNTQRALN